MSKEIKRPYYFLLRNYYLRFEKENIVHYPLIHGKTFMLGEQKNTMVHKMRYYGNGIFKVVEKIIWQDQIVFDDRTSNMDKFYAIPELPEYYLRLLHVSINRWNEVYNKKLTLCITQNKIELWNNEKYILQTLITTSPYGFNAKEIHMFHEDIKFLFITQWKNN